MRIMSLKWLLISFSCLRIVNLQLTDVAKPDTKIIIDPLESSYHSFYPFKEAHKESRRRPNSRHKKREISGEKYKRWLPDIQEKSITETSKTENIIPDVPLIITLSKNMDNDVIEYTNHTEKEEKRNVNQFKRSKEDKMWYWKRSNGIKEPKMPKSVRLKPWKGKRTRQIIIYLKGKVSKILLTTVPDFNRFLSQSERLGFQITPIKDKQQIIKVLSSNKKVPIESLQKLLPVKTFLDLHNLLQAGYPYDNLNIKKNGKRSIKIRKRSKPIMHKVWIPQTKEAKESRLKSMIMINDDGENKKRETTS